MAILPEKLNMERLVAADEAEVMVFDPRLMTLSSLANILEGTICTQPNVTTKITVTKLALHVDAEGKRINSHINWTPTDDYLNTIRQAEGDNRARMLNQLIFYTLGAHAIKITQRQDERRSLPKEQVAVPQVPNIPLRQPEAVKSPDTLPLGQTGMPSQPIVKWQHLFVAGAGLYVAHLLTKSSKRNNPPQNLPPVSR